MHGYDDILLGYGARSRQQSVDRSQSKEQDTRFGIGSTSKHRTCIL